MSFTVDVGHAVLDRTRSSDDRIFGRREDRAAVGVDKNVMIIEAGFAGGNGARCVSCCRHTGGRRQGCGPAACADVDRVRGLRGDQGRTAGGLHAIDGNLDSHHRRVHRAFDDDLRSGTRRTVNAMSDTSNRFPANDEKLEPLQHGSAMRRVVAYPDDCFLDQGACPFCGSSAAVQKSNGKTIDDRLRRIRPPALRQHKRRPISLTYSQFLQEFAFLHGEPVRQVRSQRRPQ